MLTLSWPKFIKIERPEDVIVLYNKIENNFAISLFLGKIKQKYINCVKCYVL